MKAANSMCHSAQIGAVFGAAFGLFYGTVCFFQYRAFGYTDFDLAIHTQSLWNLLRGSLDCSILGAPWPGNHSNWVILLLAPIFAIFPSPLTLLFSQATALALAGLPIYLLAKKELGEARYGLLFTIGYYVYAPVGHVALYEFHPIAYATPLLLAAFYCARIGNDRWFFLWSVIAASCQEDVPLVVIFLCLYRVLLQRPAVPGPARRISWGLAGAMLLWFVACVAFIGPYFNKNTIGWTTLYSHLGGSGPEIAKNLLVRPDIVFQTLWQSNRAEFLFKMLLPFLFLPLLAPEILLIAFPSWMQHLLSRRPTEQSLEYHYSATLTPFVLAATILGASRLFRWLATTRWHAHIPNLRISVVLCAVLVAVVTNFSYGGFHRIITHPERYRRTALADDQERWIATIPPDASVICSHNVIARLSMRRKCYSYDYVVHGRKTLSYERSTTPAQMDYALISFDDSIFHTHYHIAIRQPDGTILPQSEKLIRLFFLERPWICLDWTNDFAVFQSTPQGGSFSSIPPSPANQTPLAQLTLSNGTKLSVRRTLPGAAKSTSELIFWIDRKNPDETFRPYPFYWLHLELVSISDNKVILIPRGPFWLFDDSDLYWRIKLADVPDGDYQATLVFIDRNAAAESRVKDPKAPSLPPALSIPVGKIQVRAHTIAF